jgi:hypothetical protein
MAEYRNKPSSAMSNARSKRAKFSPLVFSQISDFVAQGLSAAEIADRIGCKLGSLRVRCSQKQISLRRSNAPGQSHLPKRLAIALPASVALDLQDQAVKKGVSQAELVLALLDAIVRDNLYDAVIDRDSGGKKHKAASGSRESVQINR